MNNSRSLDNDGSPHAELRALDPDADPLAAERFERAVASRIAALGTTPAVPMDPLYGLWSLPRPLLLAASIVAIAALGISVGRKPRSSAAPATIAESMDVPPQFLATGSHR